MSDEPLPGDLPRLWTIQKYLLVQLAQVNRAIEEAENGPRRDKPPPRRWCIQWRFTPKGTPRLGILHQADCWLATGDRMTLREIQQARQQPGREIRPCDTCTPEHE